MAIRAKFKCTMITQTEGNVKQEDGSWKNQPVTKVKMDVVTTGSKENESFFYLTPFGTLDMGTINPKISEQFVVGQHYYLDFTKAE